MIVTLHAPSDLVSGIHWTRRQLDPMVCMDMLA